MDIGTFSVLLAVKDITAPRGFYSNIGFEMVPGDGEDWTIVSNGIHVIGLFHGMFEGNILTFNPGWDGVGQPAYKFMDVHALREDLEPIDGTTSDTASFSLVDPDGNAILIDQHV